MLSLLLVLFASSDNYEGNLTVKKVQWHMKQVDNFRLQKGWLTVDASQRHKIQSVVDSPGSDESITLETSTGPIATSTDPLSQDSANNRHHGDSQQERSSTQEKRDLASPGKRFTAPDHGPVVTIQHVKGENCDSAMTTDKIDLWCHHSCAS